MRQFLRLVSVALRECGRVCCAATLFTIAPCAWAQDAPSAKASHKAPPLIEGLFRFSQFSEAGLSPSGKVIATLVPGAGGRLVLAAMDVRQRTAWPVAGFTDADVTGFEWVNDHRLVIFVQDLKIGSGEDCRFFALCRVHRTWYGVDADGTQLRRIGSYDAFVAPYADGNDDVLVTSRRQYDRSVDGYRLNTVTGRTRLAALGVPHGATWLSFDHHQRLRAVVAVSADAKRDAVWYRKSEESPWTVLADFEATHVELWPVGFSADNQTLYVVAHDSEDTTALFAYDVEQRKLADKLVAISGFDIEGSLVYSRRNNALLGVRVVGEKPQVFWLDKDFARAQASIDAALPTTINDLRGEPKGNLLVFAHSDTEPGRYFLFDAEHRRLEELVSTRPWINGEQMSAMKAVSYSARDGLRIPAYLTLPHGKPVSNLPLIALIHDGPYQHDRWGFDPEVQFLASLGYAVLQPNYRGSTQYGLKYFQAGWRSWGLAMQDDITDGVEQLVAQGLVDRKRVCIMGAGYGGYAALMGLVREPALFRCGIDRGGWTTIERLFHVSFWDFSGSIWQRYSIQEMLGDPGTMRDQFDRTSPLNQAGLIKAPVLLVYGDEDGSVPITDGAKLRDALDAHHATYQWLPMPGETGWLRKEDSRYRYYEALEQFLLQYNPPD